MYGHTLNAESTTAQILTYLVTNKHVLKGLDSVILRFENEAGTSSQFAVPLVQENRTLWCGHTDADVDIAVLQINGNTLHGIIGRLNLFLDVQNSLALSQGLAANLCEGDGVFLLGFPLGLVDQVQNLPIARGGTIARIKDCRAGRAKAFLIDCQTFPGNSGGPVVMRPEAIAVGGTVAMAQAHLIGVVSGYIPYRDVAVSRQTGRETIAFEENSGLSIVFPVDTVKSTIASAQSAGASAAAAEAAPADLQDTNEVEAPAARPETPARL